MVLVEPNWYPSIFPFPLLDDYIPKLLALTGAVAVWQDCRIRVT